MSETRVKVTLDDGAFRELNGSTGPVGRAVARAAGTVRDQAVLVIRNKGRTDSGALMQSIYTDQVSKLSLNEVVYEVGSKLEYALWQHEGVSGPIYPRRAKMLRFKPKNSSMFIFRPYVSGFSGIHYLTGPLAKINVSDFL